PSAAHIPYTTLFRARPEPADPYSAGRSETEEADRVARTVAGRVDVPPVAVLPRGQLVPQQVDEFEPGHDRRIRVEDERVFPVAQDRKSTRLNSSHVK